MSEELYKCEYCSKILKTLKALEKHKSESDTCLQIRNKQIYRCNHCSYTSIRKDSIESHKKTCENTQEYLLEEQRIIKFLIKEKEIAQQLKEENIKLNCHVDILKKQLKELEASKLSLIIDDSDTFDSVIE